MISSAPADAWLWLATDAGLATLDRVAGLFAEGANDAQANSMLRREIDDPARVAALLTQHQLRSKAVSKFGAAAMQMLFTQAGLEQASRAEVAAEHARRLSAAGLQSVTDLGSGLGAESLAFARAGIDTTAIEIDPLTATFAEHNLSVGRSAAGHLRVVTGDAERVPIETAGVFLDPARRTSGHTNTRRVFSNEYSPSLTFVFTTLERYSGGVKLGPGFPREELPEAAEAQWISVDGSVVETALWFGDAARNTVARSAVAFHKGERFELAAAHDTSDADTRELGEYLYEPDGALIRARLLGSLARQLNAGMLHEQIAYMSADAYYPTPFARTFRVREVLPAREKDLKKALRARNIGRLEIKKRGSRVDPAQLRNRLQLRGSENAVLIMTRVGGKHVAILADRVD